MTTLTDASPILTEKDAKQMLRTRREDRPRKAGFPDEPMREYMLHLQRLEQRSEEQFLEHCLMALPTPQLISSWALKRIYTMIVLRRTRLFLYLLHTRCRGEPLCNTVQS
ncbi:hypothetical protein AV530_003092 [Patagioenas fasciata monilis]|uniref:Uncharacterized protein n=1 Tax=Patagioenas fasciata monilis TaxID=372326 RepID=A0A1V4KW25_PATFA|nr:hypothetical protein AV530_003092 [Patagioenas fasciata monilis]